MEHPYKPGDLIYCPHYGLIAYILNDSEIVRLSFSKNRPEGQYAAVAEIKEDLMDQLYFAGDIFDGALHIGNIRDLADICKEVCVNDSV